MSQPNLLELAKQGHPKAIESLINRQMQPKGITAKVALKNNCLHIMLEAAQPPDQKALVPVIRKGITNLGVPSIEILKIYGKQAGEQVHAWSQEFELVGKSSPSANSENIETPPKELSLKERAKQGDVEAITKLLNVALLNKNITSKATLKDGCLSVMLESEKVPDKEASKSIISTEINNFKSESIRQVDIYGKQKGKPSFAWWEQIKLKNAEHNYQESQHEPKKSSALSGQKGQMILGVFALVFLFGSCVYNAGYPRNCEQAQEVTRKAQKDYDDNYQEQLRKVYVDKDTMNSVYVLHIALQEAKEKEYELCRKR